VFIVVLGVVTAFDEKQEIDFLTQKEKQRNKRGDESKKALLELKSK